MFVLYCVVAILVVFIVVMIASYVFLCIAVKRRDPKRYVGANVLGPSPRRKYKDEIAEAAKWAAEQTYTALQQQSNDGLLLKARLLKHDNAKGCILLFHGFRSSPERDFNVMIPFLYSLGYHLLLVDIRAHGQSEGKLMTYGVRESEDCELWCNQLADIFPDLPLFLYGTSMGASTVMFASDKNLPKSLKGIVADCGFTTPWKVLAVGLKRKTKLPPFPLMQGIFLWVKLLCHYDLRVSTVDSLSRTTIPFLFIHGTRDALVPCAMTEENYRACASKKILLLVDGGEHCTNYFVANNDYCNAFMQLLGEDAKE